MVINTLIEHRLSLDKIIEPQSTLAGVVKMQVKFQLSAGITTVLI